MTSLKWETTRTSLDYSCCRIQMKAPYYESFNISMLPTGPFHDPRPHHPTFHPKSCDFYTGVEALIRYTIFLAKIHLFLKIIAKLLIYASWHHEFQVVYATVQYSYTCNAYKYKIRTDWKFRHKLVLCTSAKLCHQNSMTESTKWSFKTIIFLQFLYHFLFHVNNKKVTIMTNCCSRTRICIKISEQ